MSLGAAGRPALCAAWGEGVASGWGRGGREWACGVRGSLRRARDRPAPLRPSECGDVGMRGAGGSRVGWE